jgi:hypothetical protein
MINCYMMTINGLLMEYSYHMNWTRLYTSDNNGLMIGEQCDNNGIFNYISTTMG